MNSPRAAIFARRRRMQLTRAELHRLALHAYSYLHLPLIAGIVRFALGLKRTVGHAGEELDTVPAVARCGGAALYLLGHRTSICSGREEPTRESRRRRG